VSPWKSALWTAATLSCSSNPITSNLGPGLGVQTAVRRSALSAARVVLVDSAPAAGVNRRLASRSTLIINSRRLSSAAYSTRAEQRSIVVGEVVLRTPARGRKTPS
jgi:hypothetical protein